MNNSTHNGGHSPGTPFTVFTVFVLTCCLSFPACTWAVFSRPVTTSTDIHLIQSDISDLKFIEGMTGPESIYAVTDEMRLLVTDCTGFIYEINGRNRDNLEIVRKNRIAQSYALGVTVGNDGAIYAGIADDDWLTEGGRVVQLSDDLHVLETLTRNLLGLNGLTLGDDGHLYMAVSNMNYRHPFGEILKLTDSIKGTPIAVFENTGAINGLASHPKDGTLYFTQTFSGIYSIAPEKNNEGEQVMGKSERFEFFDDICFDSSGQLWATGAGEFIKTKDADSGKTVKFFMEGIGSTSSCAIRKEGNVEYIYIVEIKKPGNGVKSKVYDGRGVISFPLETLQRHLSSQ